MRTSILAALAALLALPAAASAGGTATLGGATNLYEWDTAAGPGAYEMQACGGPTTACDSTIVTVTEPGTLIAAITADPTLLDANLFVYGLKPNGERLGIVAQANGLIADEKVSLPVGEPGLYEIEVVNVLGYGAVHGTAELLGDDDGFSVAAPEKRNVFGEEAGSFEWEGIAGNGLVFDCGELAPALQPCDQVLVRVAVPGDLAVSVSNSPQTVAWDYLTVYRSDHAGTKADDRVVAQTNDPTNPNPSARAGGLDPGYYLIEVGWLAGVNGTYDGKAVFTPTPPEEELPEEEL